MEIPLENEGTCTLVALEGDRATVTSPKASAPGSRFGMRVDGRMLRLKVHRCVREGERFTIVGRFIDLTRDLRTRLTNGLGKKNEAPGEISPPGDPSPKRS